MQSAPEEENKPSELLKPPFDLRKKVRILSKREAAQFDPVEAAEKALQKLSVEFNHWMHEEVDTLRRIWRSSDPHALTNEQCFQLMREAHDIKGQAATFGYPLVGAVAASLCFLLEHVKPAASLPLTLVGQHIDAISAMVKENVKSDDNPTAQALLDKLTEATNTFVANQSDALKAENQ